MFKDPVDNELPFREIASCYCAVYSGPPWNQTFEPGGIETWLRELSEKPGSKIEYITEENGPKVIAFYIAIEGENFDEIQETFMDSSKLALQAPINDVDLSHHLDSGGNRETLLQKAKESSKDAQRIVFLIDLGIREGYRNVLTRLSLWNKITDYIGNDGTVLASTSSNSQIAKILKGKMDIFYTIPIGDSGESYLFFTCSPSKIPRFNKQRDGK